MAVLRAMGLTAMTVILAERGRLLPWLPVLLGMGIGGWFSLPQEPGALAYGAAAALVVLFVGLRWILPEIWHLPLAGVASVAIGFLACGLRIWVVEAPVMEFHYYGPVTGRVVAIDRSQSDALRITLDQVWLDRVAAARTPQRLRVALRSKIAGHSPLPGERVMITAHLGPPSGATEPGQFNFRRNAFFDGLGALGYATSPLMLWEQAAPGARLIDRMRSHLSAAMMLHMPSQAGAFAAGAMTGDRSAIRQETVQDLRDSSLAHLLAISGMNLAFLIAFVFALIRYGVALWPWLGLRINSKKIAALVSLAVAAFYLALSGSNVATERAFIMVCVMLGAVLSDRKALTLRSVALAGVVLLLWKPESLLDAGFQMSFAATVALIAGFRAAEQARLRRWLPGWAMPALSLVLSSVIGGLATAPYAAAHFNRFAGYGLIANLLTVPVMGAVVMPAGAVAALIGPLGLAALPLWVMEQGSAWILWVAHWVSAWHGAVLAIVSPPFGAVPLITLAGIWLILSRDRARMLSLPIFALGGVLWMLAPRPPLLIAEDGGIVGLLGPEGRALSRAKGAGFAAENWLENDGDLALQPQAAARVGFAGPEEARQFTLNGWQGLVLRSKTAPDLARQACAEVDLLISAVDLPALEGGCHVFDPSRLALSGAVALYPQGKGIKIISAAQERRIWSPPAKPGPDRDWIGPRD